VNSPIYSTSVNLAGEKPYRDFKQMVANFENEISLFVEGLAAQEGQPSTIIDITTSPYRLVRQGEVDVTSLLNLPCL
jgi:tRNA A37 threonylcarbamoyladenosine synthetase subunit TsaC/SUA5/YrdC